MPISQANIDRLTSIFKEFQDTRSEDSCNRVLNEYQSNIDDFINLVKHGKLKPISAYRKLVRQLQERLKVEDRRLAIRELVRWFCNLEVEDIRNELRLHILELASRYNHESGYGTPQSYVYKLLNKRLWYYVIRIGRDAYGAGNILEYTEVFDDTVADLYRDDIIDERLELAIALKKNNLLLIKNNKLFNLNWINGITALGVFKDLSINERRILKMFYIEKKSGREVRFSIGKDLSIPYLRSCILEKVRNNAKIRK